mgnify:CR=1 FL=1
MDGTSKRNKISRLWKSNFKHNINAIDYLKEKLTTEYIFHSIIKSSFKAILLDREGELIKSITISPLINEITSSTNNYTNQLMNNLFNTSIYFNFNDNIYNQYNRVFNETHDNARSYIITSSLGIYQIVYKSIPDLLITGPLLLATAKCTIDYVGDIIQNGITKNHLITFTTLSILDFHKEEAFSYLNKTLPNLINLSGLLLNNEFYENFRQNPAYLIFPLLLPYAEEKFYEIYSYFLNGNIESNLDTNLEIIGKDNDS